MKTPNVVAFTLTDNAKGDTWRNILVIYNGNRKSVMVEIPEGEWNLVCNDGKINLTGIAQVKTSAFVVAPSSESILYQL
jgi:pullulanase